MIKFFRNIRLNLLSEGKTGKPALPVGRYLKYAIGEILLVVIGILIALQINNWNDQKKNEQSEILYYCRILDDFKLDETLIEELIIKTNHRINASKEILLELNSGEKDRYYLLNKLLVGLRSDVFVPRDVTFKDLTSSGNLKLLNDVTIKNSLIQYYSELENKQSQLKQNRDEKLKQTFGIVNSSIEFGMQEFEYLNNILGTEILNILPEGDWVYNKNSELYKRFQVLLLFNISMADREKQHLNSINSLMESPYQLLKEKCENK